MDDILSAALGQSGINLSFLDEQHSVPVTTENKESYGSNSKYTPGALAGTSNTVCDDDDDLTDLLSLLVEPQSSSTTVTSNTNNSVNQKVDNGSDMLDFLLKYQSDEDENGTLSSIAAPPMSSTSLVQPNLSASLIQSNLNLLYQQQNMFVESKYNNRSFVDAVPTQAGNITAQFPKLNNSQPVSISRNTNPLLLPPINLNSVNNKPIINNSDNNSPSQMIIQKKNNVKFSRSNSCINFTKPASPKTNNNDDESDIEKRRRSIQHVLSSPNLTAREKQFLMKSALSNNIKAVLPSLTTNTKGLSTLLETQDPDIFKRYDEEVEEDEDNELGHMDTFAEYMPSKVKIGFRHPDPVVETSSMASVAPPDVWYNLLIPQDVINERKLSALQLESIIYSVQQHEKLLPNGKRAGFLIGDGAGVGKGRTVAGIIYENYLHGRKRAIWLSVSNDLRYDAIRDLRDIGCHAKVHPLNKFKYDDKITSKVNGKFKKGCIFATYSSLIGETSGKTRFRSRLDQLLHWCGKDFDGVIILDECHKAKNLMPVGSSKPTKTGITVMKLQDQLPKARVIYCSATGASEPKNMAYMNRLGLWGPGTAFKEFTDFIQSIEKRGVGAMEMVAMDMKHRGMYIARQLSFTGVSFGIKEVKLCASFIEMYDASVKLWLDAREKFEKAAELGGLDGKGKKTMWGQFWSAHQRFFKCLCIAAKVKSAVNIAKEAVEMGKCIIFGLQSTGEARTLEQLDELGGELNDFISTTKGVFSTLVEKHFPTSEHPNVDTSSINEEKKRKREWRKPMNKSMKRRKREDGVEYMSSSNSSVSENESEYDSLKDTSDVMLSDKESASDSDSDEKNPFAESSSGSDEDSWIRESSEKTKTKKPERIKLKLKKVDAPTDPSMNALTAAGLNLGRQYSWANASLVNSTSTQNMKSSRTNKTSAPQGLSQQLSAINNSKRLLLSKVGINEHCKHAKQSLLDQLEVIAPYLPPNTLDELIDELGGPQYVAEMTGRKGRVVTKADGSFAYEPRSKDDVPLELLNVAEKKRFMDGLKLVAVISEAASSGISLQADRREKNQRRRVHITLELPWSADKAIQQFGRSHRSNQVSAPEYLFLISELAGEQRFASIVAKRLESLGALTHGDRRATESRDLSRYNFDTKYGRQALDTVLKSVLGHEKPLVPAPSSYSGHFFEDVKESLIGIGLIQKDPRTNVCFIADKDYTNISRFLNRILGMTVALQNALFQFFTDNLAAIIREAKRSGRWDEGIVDLGSQGESVVQTCSKTFVCPSTCGQVTTELITVSVERGLSFTRALEMHNQSQDPHEGIYLSSQLRNGKKTAVLVLKFNGSKKKLYSIYRPNIGLVQRPETLTELSKKYEKVSPSDAECNWIDQYEYSENNCSHAFWRGYCKKKLVGLSCEIGTRKRACHILCGSVLSVWSKVETILSCQPGANSKMQIIRSKLDNGTKLVGMLIPSNCMDALVRVLSSDDTLEQRY